MYEMNLWLQARNKIIAISIESLLDGRLAGITGVSGVE